MAYYRDHLTDDAAMAFPSEVIDRGQAVEVIASVPPWSRFEMTDARGVRLGDDAAVVAYRVRAHREGRPEFEAVVSSSFLRAGDSWRLAFYQQSPST